MGRQRWVYRLEPPRFPVEFPQRLERFKEASGLSWRGLARELCIDVRLVKRWRKGARPDSASTGRVREQSFWRKLLPEQPVGCGIRTA